MHDLVPRLFSGRAKLSRRESDHHLRFRMLPTRRPLRTHDPSGGPGSTQTLQGRFLLDRLLRPRGLLLPRVSLQNTGRYSQISISGSYEARNRDTSFRIFFYHRRIQDVLNFTCFISQILSEYQNESVKNIATKIATHKKIPISNFDASIVGQLLTSLY